METGNQRRAAQGKKPMQYIGARTGTAGAVRQIRTQRGFAFTVDHAPEDGDRAHTHVSLVKLDPKGPEPKATDKSELVLALLDVMPFEAYDYLNRSPA